MTILEVKRPGCGVDHPSQSSDIWAFMACSRVNFTFLFEYLKGTEQTTNYIARYILLPMGTCIWHKIAYGNKLNEGLYLFYFNLLLAAPVSGIFCLPFIYKYTGLFEMIVGVLTTCHTQYNGDRSICIFFYLIEQHSKFLSHILQVLYTWPFVSRNWRYESEAPMKPSLLTCYKQFGTNSIIVLMFVESQRVHI